MILLLTTLFACGQGDTPAETPAEDPCPAVGMDVLAGDWIKVEGSKGDHTYRIRVQQDGDSWSAWYVGGGFTKKTLSGELRSNDLKLTEVPTGAKKAAYEAGEDTLTRLYFEPKDSTCSVRVTEVRVAMVDGKATEKPVPGAPFVEYLPFPENQEFTFRPCDGPVFVEDAAADFKVAKKQLDDGHVNPVASLGPAVPVAAWTTAADDGDPACTYTFDAYFDDRPVEGGQGLTTVKVEGDQRQWAHDFKAPYSGNHHFELYRYKTCDGGEPELIAVSCLEAVLN